MSGIPFLGALFGTSASKSSDMSYPDKRTNDEWRAVLNKGLYNPPVPNLRKQMLTAQIQSSSAS